MPNVNPEILRWARETAGLDLEEAAKKVQLGAARGVPGADRLALLEAGEGAPSRPLLLRMAKQYRRPLVAFYLSRPPRTGDRGEDFRTLPDDYSERDEALLDVLLRDVRNRQAILRSALEDEDEADPLPFVGSVRVTDGMKRVLGALHETIGLDLGEFRAAPDYDAAFALLREKTEAAGIFVMLIGDLGSHQTAIDVSTFRGFAIADEVAPFVVINDRDSRAAWSFTLVHECVHVLLGQTGVSGVAVANEKEIERFCNDVAGEFLLPAADLEQIHVAGADFDDTLQRVAAFARERNVSASMVAYKLYRNERISRQTWADLAARYRRYWLENRERRRVRAREQEGGPNYYTVRNHRVGRALVNMVGRMIRAGALTTTKGGRILGVKPSNVGRLIDRPSPSGR